MVIGSLSRILLWKQQMIQIQIRRTHLVSFGTRWSFQSNMAFLSFRSWRPLAAARPFWSKLTNFTKRSWTTLSINRREMFTFQGKHAKPVSTFYVFVFFYKGDHCVISGYGYFQVCSHETEGKIGQKNPALVFFLTSWKDLNMWGCFTITNLRGALCGHAAACGLRWWSGRKMASVDVARRTSQLYFFNVFCGFLE